MSEHDPTLTTESTGFEQEMTTDRELTLEEVVAWQEQLQPDFPVTEGSMEPSASSAPPSQAGQSQAAGSFPYTGRQQPIQGALPSPTPITPTFPLRPVSGRYRSGGGNFELELRVDIDRRRPTRRISADFFQILGATKTYFGSFVVHLPSITLTTTQVRIEGVGQFTWSAGAPRVRVTIPRVPILQPPGAATVQFLTTSGSPGASYFCPFVSMYFRTVHIETDRVSDVMTPVFASYNTGSLPAPPPARTLTVASAFAEAGVQVHISAASNVVNIGAAGPDTRWSDAELHASMLTHFSLWHDEPQFRVWELVAQNHELGPGLLGIMFDQQGRHRQGCATFHAGLGGTTPEQLRLQLYTYVHELGHCFNLLHSWQKSLAIPPGVDRPAARSWMNYPWRFAGGPDAFWSVFPFQFDDGELVHLRHAFRNNIIMGGANFRVGAGVGRTEKFDLPIENYSGLQLTITAPETLLLGEPVTLTLRLAAPATRAEVVHPYLHPNVGLVQIGIRKPEGQIVAYEPLIAHCVAGERATISGEGEVIEETVYIGYGHDGLYFDHAGVYEVRAVYEALDGSQVVSNIAKLRVRNSVSREEEHLVELLLGDEQGALFYLGGSDAEQLRHGNDALEEVLDGYSDHPTAAYVRMTKGINLARSFKRISPTGDEVELVRKADPSESARLLTEAVKAEPGGGRVGLSMLELANMKLAEVQRIQGDDQAARATESTLKGRRAGREKVGPGAGRRG